MFHVPKWRVILGRHLGTADAASRYPPLEPPYEYPLLSRRERTGRERTGRERMDTMLLLWNKIDVATHVLRETRLPLATLWG